MRHILDQTAVFFVVLVLAAPASADPRGWGDFVRGGAVVVDHEPLNTGGPASDTEYLGGHTWQRVADNITIDTLAMIQHITWWGFYSADNPPETEMMRLRFYGPRVDDGLPGSILYEETFLNPLRTATGRTVWVGIDPDEYVYDVDLAAPLELAPNTQYWLEIVQIGDVNTRFRWEFSAADQNGHAFINNATEGWQATTITADTAFQLSTIPEPSALGPIFLGAILTGKRRSRKEAFDKELQKS